MSYTQQDIDQKIEELQSKIHRLRQIRDRDPVSQHLGSGWKRNGLTRKNGWNEETYEAENIQQEVAVIDEVAIKGTKRRTCIAPDEGDHGRFFHIWPQYWEGGSSSIGDGYECDHMNRFDLYDPVVERVRMAQPYGCQDTRMFIKTPHRTGSISYGIFKEGVFMPEVDDPDSLEEGDEAVIVSFDCLDNWYEAFQYGLKEKIEYCMRDRDVRSFGIINNHIFEDVDKSEITKAWKEVRIKRSDGTCIVDEEWRDRHDV